MSWTPIFWIKREDAVIYAGECTSGYRDLDITLHYNDIPHVIMDGHGEGCDRCVTWGDQLYSYEGLD